LEPVIGVLRSPGVLPLFLASCVARLPMGALGLLLVLHTHDLTGSYARGGLASGVYLAALGISGPVLARLVDRHGQTAVLCVGGIVEAGAIATLALLPDGASLAAILAAAVTAGAGQPPTGACMRSLWPVLLDAEESRHTAYSLEAVVLEMVYTTGPVLIVGAIGSWSIRTALAFCAVTVVAGNFAFALNPASRDWTPAGRSESGLAGAMRGSGVRVLVAVFVLAGLAIGAVEVAVPAALDAMGQRDLTGLLFGLWGVGSMVAGIAISRVGPSDDPPRRLAILLVAWGAAHVALGLAGSPGLLGVLLLAAGLSIAPTFVSANGMLDHLAPRGTLTEAFTWLSTGLTAGLAVGSAAGGAIAEAASPGAAIVVLGLGGFLAAALVGLTANGALRPRTAAAAAGPPL
jgi:MFS family permease